MERSPQLGRHSAPAYRSGAGIANPDWLASVSPLFSMPSRSMLAERTASVVRLDAATTPAVAGRDVAIHVHGKTNELPPIPDGVPVPRGDVLDVVIVGGGLSGLTALEKLGGHKALLLEYCDKPGGLAAQRTLDDGSTIATGAAYFTRPKGPVADFHRELGVHVDKVRIRGPVDSYFASGLGRGNKRTFVPNMWHSLDQLPKEFAAFKRFLVDLWDAGMIGEVPFETASPRVLMWDQISAAEMLTQFGPRVKALLDAYCMSALGTVTDEVSAMAFLNFYIDEIEDYRYAFPGGTAGIVEVLEKRWRERDRHAVELGAFVYDVHHRADGNVEVRYTKDGKNHAVLARQVVMAVPLSNASKVIKDLPPERHALFDSIEHANYIVHNIHTPKPVFEGSYDTWVKNMPFTDVIVSRWQETEGFGKRGSKGTGQGRLTVYQPLPLSYRDRKLNDAEVRELAEMTLAGVDRLFPKMKKQKSVTIDSNRWSQAIHIVKPGLITRLGSNLRAAHRSIVFAGNNLGVPSYEEAIYRGLSAASQVHQRLAEKDAVKARDAA